MNLLLIILLGSIWGITYPIAKYVTTNGISPLGYAFWQAIGPAVILFIVIKVLKIKFPLSWQHVKFYGICGVLGIALPNTMMFNAAPHIPAGILAVTINTTSLMIYVLALIVGIEKFVWTRFIGVMCALTGVMLIIVPKASLPSATMVPWVLLALGATFCFSLCTIYISKHHLENSNILTSSTGMLIVSSIILAPAVFISGNFCPLNVHFVSPQLAVIAAMGLSSLGYLILFRLIKTAGPVYYSLVGPIVVLTGLFWGWLFFSETLNIWLISAVIFILAGICLVTLQKTYK